MNSRECLYIQKSPPYEKCYQLLDVGDICLLRHAVEDHFGLAVEKMRIKDVGREKFNDHLRFGVGHN